MQRVEADLLKQAPRHVHPDVDIVLGHGSYEGVDVVGIILASKFVIDNFFDRQIVLALNARAVLSDVDLRAAISVLDPGEKLAESLCVWCQPHALCQWTNLFAGFVLFECVHVADKVIRVGFMGNIPDVEGGVVVHTVEVVAAVNQGDLFRGKLWQSIAELLSHTIRILAKVDGISKPGDGKLFITFATFDIFRIFGIPRLSPVTLYTC